MSQRRCYLALLLLAVSGCAAKPESPKAAIQQAAPDAAEKLVRSVLVEQFKIDPSALPMDKSISEPPLKAEDLDLFEIVMKLEQRQGIQISDAALERYLGKDWGKGPLRITPNQLVTIVREAPKMEQSKPKADAK
jgi:acyl carrier protein